MAKQANVNLTPATGAVAIWEIVDFLVSSLGFTQVEGADGTTYPIAITGGNAGANGLGNANAWVRVREPGGAGGREWIFQRDAGANDEDWRVKVSALDGFVGGTPGATQTPSATDEAVLWGGGTDASPTHATLFEVDGTYRFHIIGYDVAEDGVYPWYAFTHETGGGEARTFIGVESLLPDSYPALVGTRTAPTSGEPDPCVYICGYDPFGSDAVEATSQMGAWGSTTASPIWHWYAMNGSNGQTETFIRLLGGGYGFFNAATEGAPATNTTGFGVNALTGLDQLFSIFMGRNQSLAGSQTAFKGMTAHLRIGTVHRAYPDVIDIGSERWVVPDTSPVYGSILIPFPNGVTPLT